MAKHAATSFLQIHLPERLPGPGAPDDAPVRWAVRARAVASKTASRPSTRFRAPMRCLPSCCRSRAWLLCAPRCRAGPAAKLAQARAVRDRGCDRLRRPRTSHASCSTNARDGERLVAVLDRAMARERARRARGARLPPDRAIVESALVAARPDAWTVVWAASGGFAATRAASKRSRLTRLTTPARRSRSSSRRRAARARRRARGGPRAARRRRGVARHRALERVAACAGRRRAAVVAGGDRRAAGRVPEPPSWRGRDWLVGERHGARLQAGARSSPPGSSPCTASSPIVDWSRARVEARTPARRHGGGVPQGVSRGEERRRSGAADAPQRRRPAARRWRARRRPISCRCSRSSRRRSPRRGAAAVAALRARRARSSSSRSRPTTRARSFASRLRVPGLRVQVERIAAGAGGPVATVRVGVAS